MNDSKQKNVIETTDLGFQSSTTPIFNDLETKGYTSSKPPQIIKPEPKKP